MCFNTVINVQVLIVLGICWLMFLFYSRYFCDLLKEFLLSPCFLPLKFKINSYNAFLDICLLFAMSFVVATCCQDDYVFNVYAAISSLRICSYYICPGNLFVYLTIKHVLGVQSVDKYARLTTAMRWSLIGPMFAMWWRRVFVSRQGTHFVCFS